MTKSGLLVATAILASALASPAMAQTMVQGPGYCAQFDANGNCLNTGAGRAYRHHGRWHESYNRLEGDRTGFWPADVAAGVVGGAVGTAAAITTAPIGGAEYARRHGFVCTPVPGSGATTEGNTPASRLVKSQGGEAVQRTAFFVCFGLGGPDLRFWPFAGKSDIRPADPLNSPV